ncbi:MAG: histidinol-phosphate transaminase [Ignavibacteria bacterium GWC2_36_12]|nr:MAG: histidinol-phosphate transaminase [Ignavibacteria bacterium GWC2_36_12]
MKIKNLVRKNIVNLKPYTSARDENSSGILLDANENSLGSTFNEIKDLNLNRYPDPNQNDLRDLISAYLDVSKENLFFGVGSDEIIDLLIRIFCEPGKDKILIPEPTYGMYKVTADINNVPAVRVLLNDDFQIDLKEINKNFTRDIKIIFLCSPNNPTGNLLRKDDVLGLCKKNNSIVIVDEAYIDFAESFSLINEVGNYPNLVVMRTFSKAWGLAGARLGYCVANEEIVKILFKVKAPYNINSLTRFAIGKALNNVKLKNSYVKTIIEERENLKKELLLLPGVSKVFDSDANFLLIKCTNAKTILKKLAERKIIIRDRSSQPKLEGCLRISVGTKEENKILLNALKGILK